MNRREGFSLVEAMVASVIFAAGLLAIAAIAVSSVRTLRVAEARRGAHVAGLSVTDSLMQVEHPRSGSLVRGRYSVRWTATDSGAITRVLLYTMYADGDRAVSQSIHAIAADWPRRLQRVP